MSAIDDLPEAPDPCPSSAAVAPLEPAPGSVTNVYQALSTYPIVRSTGLLLTEALATFALANNRSLPAEPARAVRLKIRSDGEGVRYVKRRTDAGWELCFHPLEVGFSDIVEHLPEGEGGPQHWRVIVNNTEAVVAWSGPWDDRPEIAGLWIGPPWLRSSIKADELA